jgi:cell division protein FtsN
MRTNSLLTYLLYGLLAALIIATGYKACQMQQDKKRKAAEEAELQQTLRDMGYLEDSTATTGSSYANETSSAPNSNGIEASGTGEKPGTTKETAPPSASTTKQPTAGSTATTTPTKTGTTTTKPAPAPTSSATTTTKPAPKPKTTAKGASTVKGPGSGRWAVRAGTFSTMERARRRLEEVIRLGYPNAEISKTSSGMAAVVVFRSNDKNAAIRIADQLEDKGVDAAVFDRSK